LTLLLTVEHTVHTLSSTEHCTTALLCTCVAGWQMSCTDHSYYDNSVSMTRAAFSYSSYMRPSMHYASTWSRVLSYPSSVGFFYSIAAIRSDSLPDASSNSYRPWQHTDSGLPYEISSP